MQRGSGLVRSIYPNTRLQLEEYSTLFITSLQPLLTQTDDI